MAVLFLTQTSRAVDPLDVWTPCNSGTNGGLAAVTYANGLFVAVGGFTTDQSRIITSPDGFNWTPRVAPANVFLRDIAYGNSRFVAVGGYGAIVSSADGINWVSSNSGVTWYLTGVAFGNGRFVVSRQESSNIITSLDGLTWTLSPVASSGPYYSFIWYSSHIAYATNLFLSTVGFDSSPPWGTYQSTNVIFTSPDGINWVSRNVVFNAILVNDDIPFTGITYANGLYVLVGSFYESAIFTSPDTINWTQRYSSTNQTIYGLGYGDGNFVAVGYDASSAIICISPDGVTWSPHSIGTNVHYLSAIAYGSGHFVAVGGGILTSGTTNVLGIDVSHFQNEAGPIDWSAVTNAGKTFAFIKASQGTNVPDSYLATNARGATLVQMLVAPYHLAGTGSGKDLQHPVVLGNPTDEAQNFLNRAAAYIVNGYLPPVLDLEDTFSGGLYQNPTGMTLSQWATIWLQHVQQQTGITPMIYTTRSVLASLTSDLAASPLWVADYDMDQLGNPDPTGTPCLPPNCLPPCSPSQCWPNWKFKQYLDDKHGGACPGITGGVDLDSFNGDFNSLLSLTAHPTAVRFTGVGGGAIQPPSNGQFQMGVSAFGLPQITVQGSDDLKIWSDVATVTLTGGNGTFTDPNTGGHTQRFYRAKP